MFFDILHITLHIFLRALVSGVWGTELDWVSLGYEAIERSELK